MFPKSHIEPFSRPQHSCVTQMQEDERNSRVFPLCWFRTRYFTHQPTVHSTSLLYTGIRICLVKLCRISNTPQIWLAGLPMYTGSHWPSCHRDRLNFPGICWKFPYLSSSQINAPSTTFSLPSESKCVRNFSLRGIYGQHSYTNPDFYLEFPSV
jgi:hypothetical protein